MTVEVVREIIHEATVRAKADYIETLTNYPTDTESASWYLSRVVILEQLENTIDRVDTLTDPATLKVR